MTDAVAEDDLPIYSMLYVANFTALDPGPKAKTPDYTCSNNYASQFYWRIGQLTQHLSGASSLKLRAVEVPKCAYSNIDIVVTPYASIYYHSEYSHVSCLLSVYPQCGANSCRQQHFRHISVSGLCDLTTLGHPRTTLPPQILKNRYDPPCYRFMTLINVGLTLI